MTPLRPNRLLKINRYIPCWMTGTGLLGCIGPGEHTVQFANQATEHQLLIDGLYLLNPDEFPELNHTSATFTDDSPSP